MRYSITIILIIVLVISFTGCNTQNTKIMDKQDEHLSAKVEYQNITPQEAKKRLDEEKNIILLDVRTPEEYAEKHIPGSILIPVNVIEEEAPLILTDKNNPVFVYCRSGRRSITAAESLIKLGYTQVYNLGGIIDWPYETE